MMKTECPKPPRYTTTETYERSEEYDDSLPTVGVIDREQDEIAVFGPPDQWSRKYIDLWCDGLNSGEGVYSDRDELSWESLQITTPSERWYIVDNFKFDGTVRVGIVDRELERIAIFGYAPTRESTQVIMESRMAGLYGGTETVGDFHWRDLSEGELPDS